GRGRGRRRLVRGLSARSCWRGLVWACRCLLGGGPRCPGEREAVVLGEVTRDRAGVTERVFETSRRGLCDVFVERARHGARGEDALDGGVVARTERRGMTEPAIDLVGGVALPQQQDLARLCAPDSRWTEAHQPKELRRVLTHVVKRDMDL